MTTFLFWVLLLANLALLVMQPGSVMRWHAAANEPARLQQQLHPERISIILPSSLPATSAVSPPASPAPVAVPAPVKAGATQPQ